MFENSYLFLKIILYFFVFSFDFIVFSQQRVLFIYGTSCSGKTSVLNKLPSIDPNWKIVDGDVITKACLLDELKCSFAQEYSHIECSIEPINIFTAIKYNLVVWKSNVTDIEKKNVINLMSKIREYLNNVSFQKSFYEKVGHKAENLINDFLKAGYNVAIDTWFINDHQINTLKKSYSVLRVLLYCPFNILVNRLIERNNIGYPNNVENIRYFRHFLINFLERYELMHNQENAIDTIDLSAVKQNFLLIENNIKSTTYTNANLAHFSRGEFSKAQLINYEQKLLSLFDNEQILYIKPKIAYDIIMNTYNHNITECAKILCDYHL